MCSGEPDNKGVTDTGEHCFGYNGDCFYDVQCSSGYRFICELGKTRTFINFIFLLQTINFCLFFDLRDLKIW